MDSRGDDDFRGWGCDFTNLSSPTSIANFFLGVLKTRNRQTQEPLFPLQDSLCPSPDEAFEEEEEENHEGEECGEREL